jgi:hypothetical protein
MQAFLTSSLSNTSHPVASLADLAIEAATSSPQDLLALATQLRNVGLLSSVDPIDSILSWGEGAGGNPSWVGIVDLPQALNTRVKTMRGRIEVRRIETIIESYITPL